MEDSSNISLENLQNNNQQLQQQLIQEPQQDQYIDIYEQQSRVFEKAIHLFKFKTKSKNYFYISQIILVSALIFFYLKNQSDKDYLFIFILQVQIFNTVALLYQISQRIFIKNPKTVWNIAEQLQQVINLGEHYNDTQSERLNTTHEMTLIQEYYPNNYEDLDNNLEQYMLDHDPNSLEIQKVIKELEIKIRFDMKQINKCIKYFGVFKFLCQQFLMLQIIFLFANNYTLIKHTLQFQNNLDWNQNSIVIYMIVFFTFNIFNWYEMYIFLILFIICLPIYLVQQIGQLYKKFIKNRKKKEFIRSLKPKKYKKDKINGEECSICMGTYTTDDQVIVLPCNKFHHFHSNCIQKWLEVSQNCPLCRCQF